MPSDALLLPALISQPAELALLFGTLVGFILAVSGAGGGILAVPLLVFGLDLSLQQAAPIGLLATGLAAALGATLGLRQGTVRYRAASLIGTVGMLVAPAGVWLAQRLPNPPLTLAFAAVLAWTALRMLRRARPPVTHANSIDTTMNKPRPCHLNPANGRFRWNFPCVRALAITGLASGLLSGLLGVGGGFVIVPALTRHSDLPTPSVIATSLGVIALVAIGGILAAVAHSTIVWPIALPFAAGAVGGQLVGRRVAAQLSGARLQQGFALLCLLVAAMLAVRAVLAMA